MRGVHMLFGLIPSCLLVSAAAIAQQPAPAAPAAAEQPAPAAAEQPAPAAPAAEAPTPEPAPTPVATPSARPAEAPDVAASVSANATAAAPPVDASVALPTVAPPAYASGDPNVGADGYPLAGYHGGRLFVRSRNDYFKLFFRGRMHLDSYNYFGPGVSDGTLKSTMLLRRARLELGGELMGNWQWELQGEFGSTAFNNGSGTTQSYAAPVGEDPTAETARYASVQTAQYSARPIHAYINYTAFNLLNIQMGQFNLPFTMENRTSTNQITFMERAFTARGWGTPTTKDIGVMLWGATKDNVLYYSAGVFQGEGENRPNADNRGLAAMRAYTRPLAGGDGLLKGLQVGGSFKYGMHDKNYVAYDYPSMTTQGGYRFWSPTYTDGVGSGRLVHIIPSGAQLGVAGELRIPVDRFDVRGEFVYLKNNTREGVDGYQLTHTERFGTLKGYSYYVSLSYWPWGKPFLTGNPGDQNPPRLDLSKPDPEVPPQAIELAVRWEQVNATYESAARSGEVDSKNIDGDIKANFLSAGINYWASRHLRLTVNYALDMFPDSGPKSASREGGPTWSGDNRAQAPGNQLPKGANDDARDDAHLLHELMARVAVAF